MNTILSHSRKGAKPLLVWSNMIHSTHIKLPIVRQCQLTTRWNSTHRSVNHTHTLSQCLCLSPMWPLLSLAPKTTFPHVPWSATMPANHSSTHMRLTWHTNLCILWHNVTTRCHNSKHKSPLISPMHYPQEQYRSQNKCHIADPKVCTNQWTICYQSPTSRREYCIWRVKTQTKTCEEKTYDKAGVFPRIWLFETKITIQN